MGWRPLAIKLVVFTGALALVASLLSFSVRYDVPILHGEVRYGVTYANDQTLDVYLPLRVIHPRTPVVLFFHGGAWVTGTKEVVNTTRFSPAVQALRESGYAVVAADYTLATREHSPFPECIQDAFLAVEWIRDHADEYGFDPENVGVVGESAGGHIALSLAYGDPARFELPQQEPAIAYVVDVYGPSDLKDLYRMQTLEEVKAALAQLPPGLAAQLDITELLFGFAPERNHG